MRYLYAIDGMGKNNIRRRKNTKDRPLPNFVYERVREFAPGS